MKASLLYFCKYGLLVNPVQGLRIARAGTGNLLAINRDLKSIRVHTRHQPTPKSSWQGWYQWPDPRDHNSRVGFYDIEVG